MLGSFRRTASRLLEQFVVIFNLSAWKFGRAGKRRESFETCSTGVLWCRTLVQLMFFKLLSLGLFKRVAFFPSKLFTKSLFNVFCYKPRRLFLVTQAYTAAQYKHYLPPLSLFLWTDCVKLVSEQLSFMLCRLGGQTRTRFYIISWLGNGVHGRFSTNISWRLAELICLLWVTKLKKGWRSHLVRLTFTLLEGHSGLTRCFCLTCFGSRALETYPYVALTVANLSCRFLLNFRENNWQP